MSKMFLVKDEPEDYAFTVGDVVIVPWNSKKKIYHRCCITALETRMENKYATVFAFDIEREKEIPVSKLHRPDDFVMKVVIAELCNYSHLLYCIFTGQFLSRWKG